MSSCPRFLAVFYRSSVAFALTAGLSVAAHADRFQPVSPEELHMTSEPQAPGAPAIILYRQVDRDDSGRTAHEDNYFRIKILTEEGRKYGDVEIPFFRKDGDEIVNIKARTIRPDGTIASFEGKPFNKSIAKGQGIKYMAKTFTLPDVQPGSIIEYYYTIDLSEHYIYDSHWILSDELFTKHAKFSLKPYTSNYNNISVQWSWQLLPSGAGQPKEGPDRIVRLEVDNIPAFLTEDYMPPPNELKARVDFTYTDEAFEKDPATFWKKKGKKLNSELESFIGKHQAMEQAVKEIISPTDSEDAKLQKIYARVQQIRNTSYEVRKTEQEKQREKEKPAANVEEIWKKGYGEGGQITWLFLALVRAAGFEAYGVWASDRLNYFFNTNIMDARRLDANVVLVKSGGKDLYFDPGAAFTPFGMLEWEETGVVGLRLDKDGGSWVKTTVPESSVSRIERRANLTLASETGDLQGKLTMTFTGLEAMQRRVEKRNQDETDRKKFLEDQLKEYIPAVIEAELTNKPDWSGSSTPLVAEFDVKIPGWASAAGRRALLPVGIFGATEKHVFDHAERTHPIYFEYPFEKIDDVTIAIPPGWQVNSLPTEESHGSDKDSAVTYTLKTVSDKQTLHVARKVRVDIVLLDTKYYPVLRNFFQVVRKGDEQQIVLQPGGTHASN